MSSGLAATSTALCTSLEGGVLGSSSCGHTGTGCGPVDLPHRFYTAFSLLSRYIRHQTWLSTCIVVPKSDTIYEADGENEGEGNS